MHTPSATFSRILLLSVIVLFPYVTTPALSLPAVPIAVDEVGLEAVPPRFAVLLAKYQPFVPSIHPTVLHELLYPNITSHPTLPSRIQHPVHSSPALPAYRKLWLLDVREIGEFTIERVPGAVWTGRGNLEWNVEKKGVDAESDLLILYCGGGFRSILAGYNLVQMGYTNVRSVVGGIRGWKEEGYPTEGDTSNADLTTMASDAAATLIAAAAAIAVAPFLISRVASSLVALFLVDSSASDSDSAATSAVTATTIHLLAQLVALAWLAPAFGFPVAGGSWGRNLLAALRHIPSVSDDSAPSIARSAHVSAVAAVEDVSASSGAASDGDASAAKADEEGDDEVVEEALSPDDIRKRDLLSSLPAHKSALLAILDKPPEAHDREDETWQLVVHVEKSEDSPKVMVFKNRKAEWNFKLFLEMTTPLNPLFDYAFEVKHRTEWDKDMTDVGKVVEEIDRDTRID
ncbi:hypothetical protein HDU93_007930, partial [Gonapodya sp. JEL0774]